MVERGAVGVGDEEILVAVRHRPVERQRDLAHAGAYCPPGREIRSVLPDPCTCQPCAWSAAWSDAESPTKVTRMTEVPPSARLVVSAEVTPLMRLTDSSAWPTVAAVGVATWILPLLATPTGTAAVVRSEARRVGKECVSTCRFGW